MAGAMPSSLLARRSQTPFDSPRARSSGMAQSIERASSTARICSSIFCAEFSRILESACSMFVNMKSHHKWQSLGALALHIALKRCGPAAVFRNRRAYADRLRIANDGSALSVAAAGTYAPTAAGERGHSRGRGMGRAARNEVARGTPAPRRPVRTAEVEPHAGAVGLPGGEL